MSETKTKPKTETITWHSVDELLPEPCLGKLVLLPGNSWSIAYWDSEHWRGAVRHKKVKPSPTHWAEVKGP